MVLTRAAASATAENAAADSPPPASPPARSVVIEAPKKRRRSQRRRRARTEASHTEDEDAADTGAASTSSQQATDAADGLKDQGAASDAREECEDAAEVEALTSEAGDVREESDDDDADKDDDAAAEYSKGDDGGAVSGQEDAGEAADPPADSKGVAEAADVETDTRQAADLHCVQAATPPANASTRHTSAAQENEQTDAAADLPPTSNGAASDGPNPQAASELVKEGNDIVELAIDSVAAGVLPEELHSAANGPLGAALQALDGHNDAVEVVMETTVTTRERETAAGEVEDAMDISTAVENHEEDDGLLAEDGTESRTALDAPADGNGFVKDGTNVETDANRISGEVDVPVDSASHDSRSITNAVEGEVDTAFAPNTREDSVNAPPVPSTPSPAGPPEQAGAVMADPAEAPDAGIPEEPATETFLDPLERLSSDFDATAAEAPAAEEEGEEDTGNAAASREGSFRAVRTPSLSPPVDTFNSNDPALIFGPGLDTSDAAMEELERAVQMKAKINRGTFPPLPHPRPHKRSRPSTLRGQWISEAAAGPSTIMEDSITPDDDVQLLNNDEPTVYGSEHYASSSQFRTSSPPDQNPLLIPPSNPLGTMPWAHLGAGPSFGASFSGNGFYAAASRSDSLQFYRDQSVSSAGRSSVGPRFETHRPRASGRRSLSGAALGGGTAAGTRKKGGMVGRASAIREILPMGFAELRAEKTVKRKLEFEKFIHRHWELVHKQSPTLNKAGFGDLVKYGTYNMKASDKAMGKTVGDDKHYMEKFIDALRRRARIAETQRLPIQQHKLEEYERLRKDSRKRLALVLGVLGRKALPDDLTPEQNTVVEQTFRKRGTIAELPGGSVSHVDLERLRPGTWLNDESVNMYGTLIIRRSNKAAEERERLAKQGRTDPRTDDEVKRWSAYWKVHFFNTLFMVKFVKDGHKAVARWTGRKGINLFTKDVVLIPINNGNMHWTCGAINLRRKRFEYYDSMAGGRPGAFFEQMRAYLKEEHRATYKGAEIDLSGWTDFTTDESPMQNNTWDCGVFAVQTLEQLSRRNPRRPYPSSPPYRPPGAKVSAPPDLGVAENGDEEDELEEEEDDEDGLWNFSQKNINYLRRRMVYEIARTELLET